MRQIEYFFKKRKQAFYKKRIAKRHMSPVVERMRAGSRTEEGAAESDYPVWVCWWQGEENMPELVKCCYASLRENANGHRITLITKDNYSDYVAIPDYILEKMAQGKITITHFSDILRVCLLSRYGGMWIDSTILVTAPLPDLSDYSFFSFRHKRPGPHVSDYRWTAYFLYSRKNNLLAEVMKTFFLEYWKTEEKLVTYLMIDYGIAIARDSIPEVGAMTDAIPPNNVTHNELRQLMKTNEPFDQRQFDAICSQTGFHKLTWKRPVSELTGDGRPTYFDYIRRRYSNTAG